MGTPRAVFREAIWKLATGEEGFKDRLAAALRGPAELLPLHIDQMPEKAQKLWKGPTWIISQYEEGVEGKASRWVTSASPTEAKDAAKLLLAIYEILVEEKAPLT